MDIQIESLILRCTWKVVLRRSTKYKGAVTSTWDFKCKWKPYGTIRKYKVRFFVGGNVKKRVLIEPLSIYTPVVVLETVSLILILVCILGLNSHSIDFSNSFSQADIPKEKYFYTQIPTNFTCPKVKDMVLNLNKSLYIQAKAPGLWQQLF